MSLKPSSGKRAVVYARYSSDNQREASIDDQVRECRAYIGRMGWVLTEIYADPEMSGRTVFRPQYQKMLQDAERGLFDIVVCESLDRLGRRLADLANLKDELSALRIPLHTVQMGEFSDMHVAVMGMVAQQYSTDLAHKTRRGQAGQIDRGKAAGGLAYGYRAAPPKVTGKISEAGERLIHEEEAEVVRRIFTLYAQGHSPEAIVTQLNKEGIPGPRGQLWRNTTLRGQGKRGTGILRNELYVGRLVWNRASYIRLPKTGKRAARINDPSEVRVTDVPHLRILSDDLWDAVQERLKRVHEAATANRSDDKDCGVNLNATHRPKYLLTGLLRCGCCCGPYIIMGKDRYGCANHRRGTGMCENGKTIARQKVEARVLACLQDKLMAPERVQAFISEVQQQSQETRRALVKKREQLTRRLAEAKQSINHILDMIEAGTAHPSILERLTDREEEKAGIEAELLSEPILADSPILLMPNLPEVYAHKVRDLAASLSDPAIQLEATELLRQLIDGVVMIPAPDAVDGMVLELHGALAEILALCAEAFPKSKQPSDVLGCQLSVVAGAGFEPAAFRL